MTDVVDDDQPRLLGPYVLLMPLAEGGMGSIHIASPSQSSSEHSLCVVKVLKPGMAAGTDYLRRFVDEARIAVLLQHENLCHVFDAGEADGELFLAMELIEGVTFKRLAEVCRKKKAPLTTEEATALAVGLLRGLDGAHRACNRDGSPLGVVHRDVSPHNVMLDIHGRVKVIDFGLATSVLKETVTEAAVVLGKSAYMAPEQARGEDSGPTIDQYAAAIVLYELLVDDRYYGDLPSRAIWSLVGSGTHKPRAWDRVPTSLAGVLKRALAPRPGARFADCAAFADALEAAVPTSMSTAVRQALASRVSSLKARDVGRRAEALRVLAALPESLVQHAPESTQRVRARVSAGAEKTTLDLEPFGAAMADETSSTKTERLEEQPPKNLQRRPTRVQHPQRRLLAVALGSILAGAVIMGGVFFVVRPAGPPVESSPPAPSLLPSRPPPPPPPPPSPPPPPPTELATPVVRSAGHDTGQDKAPELRKPVKRVLTASALKARARKISSCEAGGCGSFVNEVVLKIGDDAAASSLATVNKRLLECENSCSER